MLKWLDVFCVRLELWMTRRRLASRRDWVRELDDWLYDTRCEVEHLKDRERVLRWQLTHVERQAEAV